MTELWLKFRDENGEIKRVLVESEKFVVGRHSGNDLSIAHGKLSREHIKIERFSDIFIVSDCDSSNGTILNGEDLIDPVALKNEDKLNLGGGLEIEVELVSDDPNANGNVGGAGSAESAEENSAGASAANASGSSNQSSILTGIFWIAPVFGLLVLFLVGGLFLAFSGKTEKESGKSDGGFVYSTERESSKNDDDTNETPTPKPTQTAEKSSDNSTKTKTVEDENPPPTPQTSGENEKISQNAASFMRRIAFNDPKPFLTSEQIEAVNAKISQFKNSAALAENLKLINKNAAQFESLANSKNLKPQFLAIAALAKIGNTRGDPLAAAQTMLPVLSDLKGTLDNKLADDNLLIIAGYARKQAGGNTPLQNVLEGLSKSSQSENVSPREIRTIWFLKKKDKISDAEFNFALQFLAIGTISQNPKDFGIDAEAVNF